MLAIFACSSAYATLRPDVITTVDAGASVEATTDFLTHRQEGLYSSITKDGQGTLTITSDANISSSLNVREGEVYIGNGVDGEHVTILAQPSKSDSPTISIGGDNASLVLDNATYKYYVHTKGDNVSYVSAVAIGNADGAGSLELKNNSLMYTSQSYFAYDVTCSNHVHDTYAGTTGDDKYENKGETGRSSLSVSSGSKLQAGITFYLANLDITVDGEGSVIEDGVRSINTHKGWLGDDDGSGATDVVTNLTVSNGGTWTSRNDLVTSAATTATTNITVTGKGSVFNSERNTSFGYDGVGGLTNFAVEKGAVANITDLTAGTTSGSETVNISIDSESALNVGKMVINAGATVSNSGTINVSDMTKVLTWRDDSSMGTSTKSAAVTETVEGGILITGGELTLNNNSVLNGSLEVENGIVNINGAVTINGALTLGVQDIVTGGGESGTGDPFGPGFGPGLDFVTGGGDSITEEDIPFALRGASNAVTLNFAEGAYIDMQGNSVSIADLASIIVTDTDGNFTLFTNVANAETLNGVEFSYIDAEGNTQVAEIAVSNGNVYVGKDTTIPEPTTATLSLLALAALAGRRRRK